MRHQKLKQNQVQLMLETRRLPSDLTCRNVPQSLEKFLNWTKFKRISCFDFSTLYTNIPHNKLLEKLNDLVDFAFKGGNRNNICFNFNGSAYWGRKSKKKCFTKHSLKQALNHLITNCYFTVGNIVMRQKIGIPMGIDPAPFWANLYLY